MNKKKIALIICWFGSLPNYLTIWMKTCETNRNFDFLIFTDDRKWDAGPENIKYFHLTKKELLNRIHKKIEPKAKLIHAYRVCDYRAMFGDLFCDELKGYEFWGYCDLDIILGQLSSFVTNKMLEQYDMICNGGHFTLMRNVKKINSLYKRKGGIFDYKTVAKHEAVFAFDETTGIQRIARKNHIKAWFGLAYVDADSKYTQIRSRMDCDNPNYQSYYWENGHLIRVKYENGEILYQELAYIHLQKRSIHILSDEGSISDSFWIRPNGYAKKKRQGIPDKNEIMCNNPYEGTLILQKQRLKYIYSKFLSIIKRNPFQIFVRIKQQIYGINSGDGKREETGWLKY